MMINLAEAEPAVMAQRASAGGGLVNVARMAACAVLMLGLLAGCSDTPAPANADPRLMPSQSGGTSMLGPGGISLFGNSTRGGGASGEGQGIGVNGYLWRGALDTLSFMPLASADPFGGVIITDWYSPPAANGERFKATAYILGRQLRADAVKVMIFRQVQQNGAWMDAPVSPGTTSDIENKVLAKARELRAQSASSL